jgi:RNA polymerase sigma factor (sigma-70 family)
MSKYQQDDELLKRLKSGNHRVWKELFDNNIDAFILFVMKYGKLQQDEAYGIYQEAIVIFHRNVTSGKIEPPLRSSLSTYIYGIGKNLCRRKTSTNLSFPENLPELPQTPFEELDERRHNAAVVKSLLARIGENCREFLTMVFLEEKQQDDIMVQMEIPSPEAFRKRKHDCLKKMRALI